MSSYQLAVSRFCRLGAGSGVAGMRRKRLVKRTLWGLVLLVANCLLPTINCARAQDYPRRPPDLDRLTQELFAEIQSDQVPVEDIYETLLNYYQAPLNLNAAGREDLRSLLLLSETQITNLLRHREANGLLLSVYELQSIEGFDLRTIGRLLPFVAVAGGDGRSARGPLWQRILHEDNSYALLRYERVLQTRQGYTPATLYQGRPTLRYLGGADKLALRYRASHSQDFSVGFSLEKDAGEPWAWQPGQGRVGFDYFSVHLVLQARGRWKTIALGDYQLQFGQGLLLSSGFAVGKGAEVITTVLRSSVGVRPYAGLLENSFFRGGAATYQLGPRWEATAFASHRNADANLRQTQDSLAAYDEFSSGLIYTGLHRTATELANRHRLAETMGGGHLGYASANGDLAVGLSAVGTHYGTALLKRPEPYNLFEFSGKNNLALGLHYSYVWRNLLLFGETARTTGGALGTVNGLLASLGSAVDAAVLVRHYPANFHSLYGNAFGENYRNINESGVYFGLKIRPAARWEIATYYDQFSFPWLRYRVGAPSRGYDALLRLAYTPSKTTILSVQLRQRLKPRNLPAGPDELVPLPGNYLQQSLLLYYDAALSPSLEVRTRLQASRLRLDDDQPWRAGYVLAQDVAYRFGRALKLTARYAVFDADHYDVRQYVYESDVWLAVSVPALYGQGTRAYALAEIRLGKPLTLWLRYAETRYRHQSTVGTGLETIDGVLRNEVKVQLRYKF